MNVGWFDDVKRRVGLSLRQGGEVCHPTTNRVSNPLVSGFHSHTSPVSTQTKCLSACLSVTSHHTADTHPFRNTFLSHLDTTCPYRVSTPATHLRAQCTTTSWWTRHFVYLDNSTMRAPIVNAMFDGLHVAQVWAVKIKSVTR